MGLHCIHPSIHPFIRTYIHVAVSKQKGTIFQFIFAGSSSVWVKLSPWVKTSTNSFVHCRCFLIRWPNLLSWPFLDRAVNTSTCPVVGVETDIWGWSSIFIMNSAFGWMHHSIVIGYWISFDSISIISWSSQEYSWYEQDLYEFWCILFVFPRAWLDELHPSHITQGYPLREVRTGAACRQLRKGAWNDSTSSATCGHSTFMSNSKATWLECFRFLFTLPISSLTRSCLVEFPSKIEEIPWKHQPDGRVSGALPTCGGHGDQSAGCSQSRATAPMGDG